MAIPASAFEKLGVFYLGAQVDPSGQPGQTPILYKSANLTTHAVCVGMTGSGKTGLCIGLLEEAAIDGIPALVIDPKGDLGNLALTFPTLQPADFAPWVNPEEARTAGQSVEQFAQAQSALWSKGLADWGQDGARIQRLKDAADVTIYTPGSTAGRPLAILKDLAVPPKVVMDDPELLRDRVSTTASSLLGLIGIKSDPMRGREHLLLCNIIYLAWAANTPLTLPTLVGRVQQPPFTRVGAMELEAFYPAKERFELASAINALLASPGFSAWTHGEPLDIQRLLYTEQGKPRIAILNIAHLADAERMFFVALLMNQVLAWTRAQSGTTSLRAIIYMDEIAGYFPPIANPPSKQPMLTMMKQARAFGVGMVLATQNPVDLDYKGLSNAGTWFIGRLQTQQDKQRVLDGLEGAAAGFSRQQADDALSRLGKRQFMLQEASAPHPVIFATRWTLSYLRGPLTRDQVKSLSHGASAPQPTNPFGADLPAAIVAPFGAATDAPPPSATHADSTAHRPVLAPGIPEAFIPRRANAQPQPNIDYTPALLGIAEAWYTDPKLGVDARVILSRVLNLDASVPTPPPAVLWSQAEPVSISPSALATAPLPASNAVTFAPLPAEAGSPKSYAAWSKSLADELAQSATLTLWHCAPLGITSRIGEKEGDFQARLALSAREKRDAHLATLTTKYTPKVAAVQEKLRKAQQKVQVQRTQASEAKFGTLLSAGAAVLGGLLGRGSVLSSGNIGRAATAARGVGRATRESGDVARAEEDVATLNAKLDELKAQFDADVAALDAASTAATQITLRPKRANIRIAGVWLAWLPPDADLSPEPRQ